MKNKIIPSVQLVRLVRLFHLSLGFFLLLSALLLNGCSSTLASVPLSWKQADTVPSALWQLVVAENTSLPANSLSNAKVASFPTQEQQQVYIFNYNSPNICGEIGCLYVAYLQQGQSSYEQVLSLYLKPFLPAKQSLFSISAEPHTSSSPCLEVKQVEDNNIQNLTYCFDGKVYQPVKSFYTKLTAL